MTEPNQISENESTASSKPPQTAVLYLTVLIIATSGLVYELLAGTLASYVLGDSVTQFSTTIGVYLFAMGIGSYASRFIKDDIAARFVQAELAVALAGGLSAPLLFLAFAKVEAFRIVLYGVLAIIGLLVGLEIPLLMRVLKEDVKFEDLIARVLTFDYIGALVGSLLFALVLVPRLGLTRTSVSFGLLNCLAALLALHALSGQVSKPKQRVLKFLTAVVALILCATMFYAERLTRFTESSLYNDPIIFAEQSNYQRIVLTRSRHSTELYLNGSLQFNERDEYRYHEALVHPGIAALGRAPQKVLILGGGDGLAVRELLKYTSVTSVNLVDLDPAVTRLAKRPPLSTINKDALSDPRVTVENADAFAWLQRQATHEQFDLVIIDFPDPNNFSLGKLYTSYFYTLVSKALKDDGVLSVQSTSPLYARKSFWCIDATLRAAGLLTHPYHVSVPSFGEWGYVIARKSAFAAPTKSPAVATRFLNDETLASLFEFPKDMTATGDASPNRLDTQALVRLYDDEWAQWN